MYADKLTEAVQGALEETNRCRAARLARAWSAGVDRRLDIAELLALELPTVPRACGKQVSPG
jgi:hypothetical protein